MTESVKVLSSWRRWLQDLRQDLRFSLRVFVSNPKFSLVAVFTLALGIGIASTVFSWIDSLLLHPYPGVNDTNGLALIETQTLSGEHLVATSYVDYRDYRENLKLVSAVVIARFTPVSMGTDGNAERAWAELVSANFLLDARDVEVHRDGVPIWLYRPSQFWGRFLGFGQGLWPSLALTRRQPTHRYRRNLEMESGLL